ITQHATALAVTHVVTGVDQCCGHFTAAFTVTFEQMKGNALCRLRSHAGHATQGLDQPFDSLRIHAWRQYGSFRPCGCRGIRAVMPENFSRVCASTRRTAPLTAAATRSSTISGSSLSTEGSIRTCLTS